LFYSIFRGNINLIDREVIRLDCLIKMKNEEKAINGWENKGGHGGIWTR
jgi:hypothetical protein